MTRLDRAVDPTRPIPPAAQPARIAALAAAVREHTPLVPEVGIVLGSGLGGLADDLEDAVAIPFDDAAGLAGGHRPGPRRAGCCWADWRETSGHAPGPVPPVRGQ